MSYFTLGITGASGTIYAEKLLEQLVLNKHQVSVIFTDTGKVVSKFELSNAQAFEKPPLIPQLLRGKVPSEVNNYIEVLDNHNFFACSASGSAVPLALVIVPSSMGTLARIAHGMSSNLLERSADVVLKEKKNLIICPRESPFNAIHLENMLSLSKLGAQIVPLSPGFYHHPKNLDDVANFMVGRILELMNIKHTLYVPWGSKTKEINQDLL